MPRRAVSSGHILLGLAAEQKQISKICSALTSILTPSTPFLSPAHPALLGFSTVLNKRYFNHVSPGIEDGVELTLSSELQEFGSLLCDTGSSVTLLRTFSPTLDSDGLKAGWQIQGGHYSSDEKTVEERARVVRVDLRIKLYELKGKDLVVVIHGNFMRHLSGDQDVD
jgi:hypothetical protein